MLSKLISLQQWLVLSGSNKPHTGLLLPNRASHCGREMSLESTHAVRNYWGAVQYLASSTRSNTLNPSFLSAARKIGQLYRKPPPVLALGQLILER